MLKLSAPVKWGGFVLIVLVGLIHAVDAPEYFAKATYVGVLFVLNVLGALVAAYGIWRGSAGAGGLARWSPGVPSFSTSSVAPSACPASTRRNGPSRSG